MSDPSMSLQQGSKYLNYLLYAAQVLSASPRTKSGEKLLLVQIIPLLQAATMLCAMDEEVQNTPDFPKTLAYLFSQGLHYLGVSIVYTNDIAVQLVSPDGFKVPNDLECRSALTQAVNVPGTTAETEPMTWEMYSVRFLKIAVHHYKQLFNDFASDSESEVIYSEESYNASCVSLILAIVFQTIACYFDGGIDFYINAFAHNITLILNKYRMKSKITKG